MRMLMSGMVVWLMLTLVAVMLHGTEAVALPDFSKALKNHVKSEYGDKVGTVSCTFCHPSSSDPEVKILLKEGKIKKSKEVRNVFGQAVRKAMKLSPEQLEALKTVSTKRTDEQKKIVAEAAGDIIAGLKKALAQQSQFEGKTFGDIIREGKKPASKPESK